MYNKENLIIEELINVILNDKEFDYDTSKLFKKFANIKDWRSKNQNPLEKINVATTHLV